ncbi:oligosaccharyl transferase delta subunit [Dentipellis sp. KUC8613]|nr:oligosaccharyl transferase delta subunit [Dentipellis sp. KUC8613]
MGRFSFLLLPLLAAAAAHASHLTVQSPRFSVLSPTGEQVRAEPLSLSRQPEKAVELGPSDTLKLTFTVAEKETDKGVQPHQTFLRFYDEATGEEGVQPLKVSASGKAKFELNMARPPSSLPPSGEAPLKVSLLLGSFTHDPAKFDLFDLRIPESLPPPHHPDEATFHPLPEIQHTFRPEEKSPMMWISMTFLWIVLSPWLVLLFLWGQVSPSVPHLFSASTLPFTLSLILLELLIMWYWVELQLGDILLYGSGASVLAAVTGKQALAAAAQRRIKGA